MNSSLDTSVYTDGAKRMIAEGLEVATKIMSYIKQHESKFKKLSEGERKKELLQMEQAKLFNQVHPVVFQYLAVEGLFNLNAFKRYVMAVFGKPKSQEDQQKLRSDRKYVYHFKNAQQALYYKYLLIETNPNVNKNTIHKLYQEMVNELNAETDKMLDSYEKAEAEAKVVEQRLTEQKRTELVELLKQKLSIN